MKRTIRVVLQQSIPTLGEPGEVKDVAFGYAKNALFPKKLAVPATEHALKQATALKARAAAHAQQQEQAHHELRTKLSEVSLRLEEAANEDGALYGGIHHKDIEQALAAQGIRMEASLIDMPQRIDTVGQHTVLLRVGREHVRIPVEVVAATPKAPA